MLQIPSVQKKIVDIALNELTTITGNQISIGKIQFKPFNYLDIQQIYAEDLKGDTLLYAEKLSTGFNLFKLLKNELLISSVDLEDFVIHINKDSIHSKFNFQFLIDAFASKDTIKEKSNALSVEIDNIRLKNGRILYDIIDQPQKENTIDFNHIHINSFHSKISLQSIDMENLNVKLRSLSFHEQSGFTLTNLKFNIYSDKQKLSLEDFSLQLPESELKIPTASINYSDIDKLTENSFVQLKMDSKINPKDLYPFFSPLKNSKDIFTLNADIEGNLPQLKVTHLNASIGNALKLYANASLADYNQWEKSQINLDIRELALYPDKMNNIFKTFLNTEVPEPLKNAGTIKINASLKGHLPKLNTSVNLLSESGEINLTGDIGYIPLSKYSFFDLTLNMPDFNVYNFTKDTIFGKANLQIDIKGESNKEEKLRADMHAKINRFTFNKYDYNNISANISYVQDSVLMKVTSTDPNVKFNLDGTLASTIKKQWNSKLSCDLEQISLYKLNLLPNLPEANLQASMQSKLQGKSLDDLTGYLNIDNLYFQTETGAFSENQIKLTFNNTNSGNKNIRLESELLKANITGNFSVETLSQSFNQMLNQLIPSFNFPQKISSKKHNSFEVSVKLNNTETLSQTFSLPFTNKKNGNIKINYGDSIPLFNFQADFPYFTLGNNSFRSSKLDIQTKNNGNLLTGNIQTYQSDTTLLKLGFSVESDSLDVSFNMNNPRTPMNGSILFGTKFRKPQKEQKLPDIFVQIHPTKINLRDQAFEINPSFLSIQGDIYTIKNFRITHPNNGNISLDGIISSNENDSLTLNFEHLHPAPLAEMFNYKGVKFNAVINGGIILKSVLSSPVFTTEKLSINDISIENKQVGNLDISSVWNEKKQSLILDALLHQTNNRTSSLSGYLIPERDSISVDINLQDIQADIILPFAKNILSDIKGNLGANIKARGSIKKPTLNGFIYFKEISPIIAMNHVKYLISDTISITPTSIIFDRFSILDEAKNQALITGKITHKNFKTFDIGINLGANNFTLLNNPEQKDSLFFGKLNVYASLDIDGTEKGINVKANIKKGTKGNIFIQLPESETEAGKYENIVYVNHEAKALEDKQKRITSKISEAVNQSSLPLNIDINAEITPDLTMGVIINPETQDKATVKGNGNAQFRYNTSKNEMKLFGGYIIEEGKCVLSLKNITKKEFSIQKGSSVTFKGNPMATSFNITAIYSLRADLTTLDESFATDIYLPNSRVKTDCILNISGDIDKMNIAYDVKLPDVDESVQRKASGLMYSDEIRIKEVAYLLALGSFYPPDGNQKTSTKTSIWTSLASSTLTTQLNNLLSGVLKENWTVGTSLHSNDDGFSNMEMDLNVSTRLFNNRLTVNTNLGYKNDSSKDTNFTGDFQAEYKLTKTGEISLKAYNVTNDDYYRQSLTTQGVGIVYRKEAKTFKQLFKKTIRKITGNAKKEENK